MKTPTLDDDFDKRELLEAAMKLGEESLKQSAPIHDISEGKPNAITELICVKCLHRSIHVFPSHMKTKDLECSCGETGYLIRTGEEIFDEPR